MLRRKIDTVTSDGYWQIKSRSLADALNRALLVIEVVGENNIEIVHTRSRKGKHIISLRTPQENTPA